MLDRTLAFLYNFDIIGPIPKLYIFNKERYQSIFSLSISLLIIALSLVFILYSLIDFVKNERPTVIYSKSNDQNEKREINLKDVLIMFQIINFSNLRKINESIAYFEGLYEAIYENATSETVELNVKKCKLGENLNSKYEKFFNEKFSTLSRDYNQKDKNIEDFYCIDNENYLVNLFYYPNIGYSSINLNVIINNQKLYKPEDISIMMIYENNLINHDEKKSPISEGINHEFIQGFSSTELTSINLNFQYLKYETDDGFFFESLKFLNGMSFLNMDYFKKKQEDNYLNKNSTKIGSIKLEFNKSNYDYYRRTYKRVQALIAEMVSVVGLLFDIGGLILEFLNNKKMSVDVIYKLIKVNNQNRLNKMYNNLETDRVKLNPEKINNSFRLTEKNNMNMKTSEGKDEQPEKKNERILRKINVFNIIKSFFSNDNKDRLISLCHNIIIKDMCVETILEKFYILSRIYNSILDVEKNNLGLIKEPRFREINTLVNAIHDKENKKSNGCKT